MSTDWMFNKININVRITYVKICSIFLENMKNIICFNSLRWIKFQIHSTLLYYKFQLHVFKNVYQKRVFFCWGGIGSLFILTCIKIRGYVKTSLLIPQLYTIWRHNYTLPSSAFILKVLRICVVKSKVIFLKEIW